jgi:RNA processing factor Prp31
MSKIGARERGKVARVLANFCAKSLKIDYRNPTLDMTKLKIVGKSVEQLFKQNGL